MLCFSAGGTMASAWLQPAKHFQTIAKQQTISDITQSGIPRFTLREFQIEWGAHRNLMINLKHRAPARAAAAAAPAYDPPFHEIAAHTRSPVTFYLFPPFIDRLAAQIFPNKVTRERPTTIGVGYANYGRPQNRQSHIFASLAIADKIQIANVVLIGHLTLRKFSPARAKHTDIRALLLLEVGKLSAGIEYASRFNKQQIISENMRFIEFPIGNTAVRLRLGSGKKYYSHTHYREAIREVSIRFPIKPRSPS